MNHIIPISSLTLIGLFILWPITRKPLSEDEGNWYYLSVFRKRGLRPFKNYSLGGFDVKYMASLFYNIIPGNNIAALQYFKILWYTTTGISIYILSFVFWHNTTLSFIAGLLFIIIVAVPSSFFTLTYAEHFLILPANLRVDSYQLTAGSFMQSFEIIEFD